MIACGILGLTSGFVVGRWFKVFAFFPLHLVALIVAAGNMAVRSSSFTQTFAVLAVWSLCSQAAYGITICTIGRQAAAKADAVRLADPT